MITITDEDFERLVIEGVEMIPTHHREDIKNVAVVIENEPTTEHLRLAGSRPGWMLFGLYQGIPLTQRGENYMFTIPDKISIFKAPILEKASTLEEAREIVKNTVWHEFAHYFGFDEEEVEHREVLEGRDRF